MYPLIGVPSSSQILHSCLNSKSVAATVLTRAVYKWKSKRDNTKLKEEIPRNVLQDFHTAHLQPTFGVPYDSKPFKMYLEQGKDYMWCACGQSHSQPICDGFHRFYMLNIKLRPVKFQVAKSGDYWLCNCKRTKNRPFCDGSHRDPLIQDACKTKHVCTGN